MSDPRYFDKWGRVKMGDCYQKVAEYVVKTKGAVLVHGLHKNPDGLLIPHAWVEQNNQVFDGDSWRLAWLWALNNQPLVRYTREEAMRKLIDTGHYGPWDQASDEAYDVVIKCVEVA